MSEQIDSIKQKHKVIKKKDKYVHKIEVKYPNENVSAMKESWVKGVEEINEWLNSYEVTMTQTVEDGKKKFLETLNERGKYFGDYEKLTQEDKLKRMEELFNKEKEAYLKTVEDKDKLLVESENNIKSEFERVKRQVEDKRKQYLEALHLWNNPEVK